MVDRGFVIPATPQPPGHISRAELDRYALQAGFAGTHRLRSVRP
jgi:hypothetical protein